MTEYINRKKIYPIAKKVVDVIASGNIPLGVFGHEILDWIDDLPAADVRPVVLCRDCKHKGWVQEPEHGKSVDYCRLIERCVDKQFFCAAGERKTNCGADVREES